MSLIGKIRAGKWIKNNHPENGLFRVYWKDVEHDYIGGATLDPNKGEGLRYEWYYKDGEKDGISKGWYPNGKLKSEWCYKNERKDGLWKSWWNNGQKKEEGTYKDGELISKKEWNEDGQKK